MNHEAGRETTKQKAEKHQTKKRGRTPFKGTGVQWFAVPTFLMGSANMRGKLFQMDPSPELRLYLIVLAESARGGKREVTLDNAYLTQFGLLNRTYLPRSRRALEHLGLVKAVRVGMSSYRYQLLDEEGMPLRDKTKNDKLEDSWVAEAEFEYARQTLQTLHA